MVYEQLILWNMICHSRSNKGSILLWSSKRIHWILPQFLPTLGATNYLWHHTLVGLQKIADWNHNMLDNICWLGKYCKRSKLIFLKHLGRFLPIVVFVQMKYENASSQSTK